MLIRNQAKYLQRVLYWQQSDCKKSLRNGAVRWDTGQLMKISLKDHTFISHMQALEELQKRVLLHNKKSFYSVSELLLSLWSCNIDWYLIRFLISLMY